MPTYEELFIKTNGYKGNDLRDQLNLDFQVVKDIYGKNIMVIGDSLTAANKWQTIVASLLQCSVITHALGGASVTAFVDGATIGGITLPPLASDDLLNIDAIVVLGPYNNRASMSTIGSKTDMHPAQNTLWGKMNYVISTIYSLLNDANNLDCKVIWAGVHAFGKYAYADASAYDEYPVGSEYTGSDFNDKLKEICNWNGVPYIDLFNNSGINKYTWNKYQSSSQPNSTTYIGYVNGRGAGISDPFPDLTTLQGAVVSHGFVTNDRATVSGYEGYYTYNGSSFVATSISNYYPWLADQLHPNTTGYFLIGRLISKYLNNLFAN